MSLNAQAIEGDTLGVDNGRLRVVTIPNGEGYQADDSSFVQMSTAEERLYPHVEDFVQSIMVDPQDWAPPCCFIFDSFVGWVMRITDPLKIPGYFDDDDLTPPFFTTFRCSLVSCVAC